MDVNTLTPEEQDALAGELALGVLEGEERAAALRLAMSDRAFAARVDQWRDHLGGLADAVPPVEPSAQVWDGIARAIGAETAADAPPVALPPRGVAPWWRGVAFGSMAAAAALATLLVWPQTAPVPVSPAPQSFAVAQLSGPIEGLRIAARYDPATAELRVRTIGMPDTPTEPELWIVPADGVPRSLGQIRREGETLIVVAEGHRTLINPQGSLQLSMEPPSPTPHASPSSDMVARGAIDVI
jgi:anti-sigma-K factor RskA